jgi:nanoRNase/pAp phosphatase (c-di-AMP/oligoRNAs hydrolase)
MIPDATLERYAALAELMRSQRAPGRWVVLTHDNPDPDAIAAAAALARLLRTAFGRDVTVAYGGLVGRAENREMVRVLRFRMSRVRELDWSGYRHVALVDTQPLTGNNQLPAGLKPDLVFDHHPIRAASRKAPFFDIRPEYGASATILAEYLLAAEVPISRRLATAVLYAIRSETQDFRRHFVAADKQLHDRLLPGADNRALGRIQSPRLPLSYFSTLHGALEALESVSTLVVSHLGAVAQPDIVPEVADLLIRMEGKTWSFATGLHGERMYLSLRTSNARGDAGRLMRRLVGKRGKGGGHGMAAGGWIVLDKAPGGDPVALQGQLARRLAAYLKKNPDRLQAITLAADV